MTKMHGRTFGVLSCIIISGAYASPSYAQTAEETVAFILEGFEDNTLQRIQNGASLSTSHISHKPGTNLFEVKELITGGDNDGTVTNYLYTLNEIGKCRFSMEIKNLENSDDPDTFEIDMANYTGYEPVDGLVEYKFTGPCPVKLNNNCSQVYTSSFDRKDYSRLNAATTYLQSKICVPGAF